MADPISTTLGLSAAKALPAATAPSILGGGITGAGMMTAGAPVVPGLLVSSTPSMFGGLGALGTGALEAARANPFQTASLGLGLYDRMNPSQAPLQPSPMQQLMRQQQPVPIPEFNSILQASRRPILIG